jgi:hypothetical protein
MRNVILAAVAAGALAACGGSEEADYVETGEQDVYADARLDGEGGYGAQGQYATAQSGQQPAAYGQQPQQMQQRQMNPQNGPNAPQPSGGQPASNGMQLVKIIDRNGFEQPMIAYIKEVPAGWRTEGGINWQMNNSGCGKTTPAMEWRATSPDGSSAVTILPAEQWSGHNLPYATSNTCPNVQITDTKLFIMQYAQRLRPGARILDYRDRTNEIQELQSQLPAPQRDPYGGETRMWAGAGQALIGYNMNGVEMREIIGTVVMFSSMRSPDAMTGGPMDFISIISMPGFAMRAPEGKLDFALAERIRLSGKGNPAYEQKMAAYYAKNNKIQADSNRRISEINRKGAADRSAIIAKTSDDIRQMQMDTFNSSMASGDYIQRETSEAIRGVETYNDGYNGGTVELDNTYDYNWQLENGDIVQTNDANFNVYENTGQFGTEMEVTE